jgi:L,D-transpeptidase ErfK/SrfK
MKIGGVARRLPGLFVCLGLGMGAVSPVAAETFRLSGSDDVVGQAFYVKARQQDTLLDVGRHNGFGYDEMKQANPRVDMWVPGEGADVLLPARFVLPNAPREGLVLNLAEKRLYYFPGNGEVTTHAVSIGRDGLNTPLGTWAVIRKDKNPTWTPTANHHADRAREGREPLPAVVPPGPDNPLGAYALRLSAPSILIHGTNKPWGLGMEVSRGCIRMYPEDIERLFPMVPVRTPVHIVDQAYKVGWSGGDLYLEVHRGQGERPESLEQVIPPEVAQAAGVTVDWDEVRRAVEENTGLPRLVGGRQKSAHYLYLDMIF